MKIQITVSGVAMLALVMLTNSVDARVMGGSSMSSSHTSSVNNHSSVSSLGSSNGKHMRKFNDDGQDDPPPKKTPQGGSTNGSSGSGYGSGPKFHGAGGYYQHPYYGENGPPLACKGRPC